MTFHRMNKILFLAVSLFLLSNCTITLRPRIDVNVIDVTDSLEKQILGEFKIIESNYLYIDEPSSKVETDGSKVDTDFYKAMKERIYFSDIIDDYKMKHLVGEGADGLLRVIESEIFIKDSLLLEEVTEIVDIDNRARKTIVEYIAEKNKEQNNIDFYWNTFHKISVKRSPTGTLFEEEGVWKEK